MSRIRSKRAPECRLCGSKGRLLYSGMADRTFSAPGLWSLVECPNRACGLLWLDPMPVQEDIGLAYQEYYTHATSMRRSGALHCVVDKAKRGYLARKWGYGPDARLLQGALGLLPTLYPGKAAEYDFSVMWLPAHRVGRLLDVGAGGGDFVERMCELGWKAEGLDFDPRSVEKARARGLTFHFGSLAEQGFRNETFDAITMSHSLEHVHDPVAWLGEARRLLVKPGGQLRIATPNATSALHRKFGASWFALEPPRHLHLFKRQALASALRQAGFQRFSLFTTVRDVNGAWHASRSIRRTGRHDMLASPSHAVRFAGRCAQLGVSLRKILDAEAGEELVAVAEA